MQTRVMPFGTEAITEAARLIKTGAPVAVPTETVYGLAADARSPAAVAEIYAAKGRPSNNPLIIHVASIEHARAIGDFSARALALAQCHWPGPLTLVVPRRRDADLAPAATAGLPTVALRIPDHRAMQALLIATGLPLAAPSANASGTISPTTAEHVRRTLDGRIALIVDDGPTRGGIESTIISACGDHLRLRLLRRGPLDIADAFAVAEDAAIEAPGQLAAHYAPSKPLRLNAVAADSAEWLIGFGPISGNATLSPDGDLAEAARNLFALLHAADAGPAERIAVAPIPESGLGLAINDRLRRAARGAA